MRSGPLDKWSDDGSIEVRSIILETRQTDPLDFGSVKAGETSRNVSVDLSSGTYVGEHDVALDLEGLGPGEGRSESPTVSEESPEIEVAFAPGVGHDGGTRQGTLHLRSSGQHLEVPVRVEVTPLTFWERWGRLILTIAAGVGILIFLAVVVYGFVSPYEFPEHLRFNWGEKFDRLDKNELVITEVQGTDKGFYQNATFEIGGRGSALSVGGTRLCTLEATGNNQVTLRAGDGVDLKRVNKFNPDKESTVEGNSTLMTTGDVYRAGSLYIRIR